MKRSPLVIVIFTIIVLSVVYLAFHNREQTHFRWLQLSPSSLTSISQKQSSNPYWKWSGKYRKCLSERLERFGWRNFSQAIDICLGEAFWRLFQVQFLRNSNDIKPIILPVENDGQCQVVTLGIGNDIDAEVQLKKLSPECEFAGAEPINESGVIYEKLGKFHQVAVGGKEGTLDATVLIDGKYVRRQVQTITFVQFIKEYVKVKRIDYLLIDAEGAELGILEHMLYDGQAEQNDIVVCQMAVELHGMPLIDESNHNRLSMIERSPFIPLWSSVAQTISGNHGRWLFLNVEHPSCIKKYLFSRLI